MDSNYMDSSQFSQDQKQEIEKGILEGLDVSIYAKPEFLAIQMLQIRIGLEEKLPVDCYAKKDYDWFQMEEIRKGLKSGVAINKYSSPDISFNVMRQIREGLEQGIDLSKYKMLKAGVLKQLRLAAIQGINIMEYIQKGYEEEQLEQIRIALEKKIDIDPYLSVLQRGAAIREIRLGLEKNLDVTVYADCDMSWQQMREIRIGMEKRLDIDMYKKKLYSWEQMREIRLGLEKNLDVNDYKSLMYTAREMSKRRHRLIKRSRQPMAPVESKYQQFILITSVDEMEAYIVVSETGVKIPREDILTALKEQQITTGIKYDEIDRLDAEGAASEMVTLAQGVYPKTGENGWYEYLFETDIKSHPKLQENGSVDYQNIKWFEVVKKDTPLAYYHPAKEGTPGTKITGELIPGLKGKEMPVIKGVGFKVLPDKVTYVANVDGKVEIKDGKLEVTDLLVLDSVSMATGNIEFNGSVYIKGAVGNGVTIKAERDILVDGFTESAILEAGGDIILKEGNNAGGNGYIKAGRDIMGKFFENTKVTAGGSVKANYCLNSSITAEKEIEISGNRGILAGGMANAGECIISQFIGNAAGIGTIIMVGREQKYMLRLAQLDVKEENVNKELSLLQNAYQDIQRKYSAEVRNSNPLYLKVENAIYTKEHEGKEIQKEKEQITEELSHTKLAKVTVAGTIYQGVRVNINGELWNATQTSKVTLRKRDGKVAIYRNI